ncbi:hypothetical protein LOK49_LG05G01048 [Camellia lanceoleosa]|uniref:Uncharacterized protein n=1 Tax=Camellia lanceoleosa TaxID=1840588 RepID=A0ACC0HKI2_9ERIC|nr:hypothetical protein LOK49_LG05G01048 [Camellia lanceoleosa]
MFCLRKHKTLTSRLAEISCRGFDCGIQLAADPGIAEHDVEFAVFGDSGVYCVSHVTLVAHVAVYERNGFGEGGGGGGGDDGILDIRDYDLGAVPYEMLGGRLANAVGATGYHRHFTF